MCLSQVSGSPHAPCLLFILFYILLTRRLENPRICCYVVVRGARCGIGAPGFKSRLRYYFCVTLHLSSFTCKRGMRVSTSQGDTEAE